MRDIKKLIIFLGLFVLVNLFPFYIVINSTPIYIIWLENAALTMYLLSVKSKRYVLIGSLAAFIIETIRFGIILHSHKGINLIALSLVIAMLNVLNAFIIYKLINRSGKLSDTNLAEIINITFFKVIPSIAILSVLQAGMFEIYTIEPIAYKFYNFFLSDFLGYVFVFTIFYILLKNKVRKFKVSSEFFIFFIVIFAFNTEEVYFKNIFDMNRSHLEYISIFILVLSCILLKAEEFLVLIIEDFVVSFCMITLFMNNLSEALREYLVSDVQLFYTVVLTTCFFIIILKSENRRLVKEISIKNKKLGEEVIENREMLKKVDILIDSIKNTAFIADENGEIVYSNKSFKLLFNEKNINDINFFKTAIIELKEKEAKTLRKEMIVENMCIMQEIFITQYDECTFISGIGIDITRLKVIQGKLERSKEEAEEANNAKSSLLARVSHELKTPMNTITGINYLLLESELSVKQEEYARKIESASKLLLRMIEDILDVSKVKNSRIKLEKKCISLKRVIQETSFVKEDEILKKGLKFIKDVDDDLPEYILGDEFRLEQILINLIGNAIKFTSKGYIKLSVKVNWKKDLKSSVRFCVEDTGIGIAKEKCKTIFEAFTQEDESITRRYGGTGLGLTICKNIIEELEGGIKVESEKGKGSKFIIDIVFLEIKYGKGLGIVNGINEVAMLSNKEKKNKKNIDKEKLREGLESLTYYIKNDVGEVMDVVENLNDIVCETEFESKLDEIKELVNLFELDKAKEKTELLKNEIFRV